MPKETIWKKWNYLLDDKLNGIIFLRTQIKNSFKFILRKKSERVEKDLINHFKIDQQKLKRE